MRFLSRLAIVLGASFSISYLNLASDRVIGAKESQELNNYIAIFHEEMDSRGVKLEYNHISIRFVEKTLPGAVAVAYPYFVYYFIDILEENYRTETPEVQEALVMHELGHVFGLNHLDDYSIQYPYSNLCPESVMHSSDPLRGCYLLHRKEYFDEIANRIKKLDGMLEI